jgi:hypothetical protein
MAGSHWFAFSIRDGDRRCGRYRPPTCVGDHLALLMMRPVGNDFERDQRAAGLTEETRIAPDDALTGDFDENL